MHDASYQVIEHTWIPMHDSVRLSARLWLPAVTESVPVVLEYLPYRKRDSYRPHDDAWGALLAGAGIAFARIDIRGTGDSEGLLEDEYSEAELIDGEACIAWLSEQDWCNGRVGLRGISWGGINSLMLAARRPPALAAIISMAAVDNRFTGDAHYIGGLLGRPNLDWGVLFRTVLAGPPDPAVVGDSWRGQWLQRLESAPHVIANWMRHPTFDAYWQRGSVCLDYDAVGCPTYVVAGWYDTYVDFVGRMLAGLSVPCKGLIGPWGHTYPELARPGGVDWAVEEIRWWRHWLAGIDDGLMDEPVLRAFMPYQTPREALPDPVPGRWVAEQSWPPGDRPELVLSFGGGSLEAAPVSNDPMVFEPDGPVGAAKAEWLDLLPEEQSVDDARSLVFDSEPLTDDVEILGYPSLILELASDETQAAVTARLTEVSPTGESWLVSYGMVDLAHREGHSQPEPLMPGRWDVVRLKCFMTAHRFKRGHRIRLALSGGLWPMTWPASAAMLKFRTTGCSLSLPVRSEETQPEPFPMDEHRRPAREEPRRLPPVSLGENGYLYERDEPAFIYGLTDVGTTLSGSSESQAMLTDDGRCRWTKELRRGWSREGWRCEVVAGCEIEASGERFVVREYLRAFHDDVEIFQRDETVEVPRSGS
jgi:predicted acyl esterase